MSAPNGEEASAPGSATAGRLRTATIEDLDAISEIETASFPDPWSHAGIAFMLGAATNRTWVAIGERNGGSGEVEGFLSIFLQPPEAEILRLAVLPVARRRGIGAELLRHALEWLRHSGVSTVYLEVREENEAALALYRQNGFSQSAVRPHYYSNGSAALVLSRSETASRGGQR